jgi:phosphomevalonate kinase
VKVFAPGKLVLTGAYVVLHGAPAIVVATTRGAVADSGRTALQATREVRAAIGDEPAPHVDASALFVGDRKLGLGASAAILVASLAAREAERGADLGDAAVRSALFERGRVAHAKAQGGGSGVDVAASVFGGTLRYVMGQPPTAVSLPASTRLSVFACGTSARTSELRADVDRLAVTNQAVHRACLDDLDARAREAAAAVARGDHPALVAAVARTARGLDRLGTAAGAPLVPRGFDELERIAAAEGAAFCVSGAGGGDVAVLVGSAAPSPAFLERAHALGLFLLDVNLDEKGVRVVSTAPAFAGAPMGSAPAR